MRDREAYNAYQRQYQLQRYHRLRKEAIEFLGGKCVVCNTKDNLKIDHIVAADKEIKISDMWSISKEKIWKELEKCQILCHEHHLIKTKLFGDSATGGGHNRIDNYDHGTWHMYTKDKCRCEKCVDWRRNYRKKLVDSMGRLRK